MEGLFVGEASRSQQTPPCPVVLPDRRHAITLRVEVSLILQSAAQDILFQLLFSGRLEVALVEFIKRCGALLDTNPMLDQQLQELLTVCETHGGSTREQGGLGATLAEVAKGY